MADTTRKTPATSDQEPGHYGAGYGEQVPEGAPPQLGPATDGDAPAPAGDERARATVDDRTKTTAEGDDGEAVVFTPDDVHVRPPDEPPTDAAPESEKAGLIFERS